MTGLLVAVLCQQLNNSRRPMYFPSLCGFFYITSTISLICFCEGLGIHIHSIQKDYPTAHKLTEYSKFLFNETIICYKNMNEKTMDILNKIRNRFRFMNSTPENVYKRTK